MKKIIAFALAMVMTMAMAACASSTDVQPATNGATVSPATTATTAPAETEPATLPDETKPVPPAETEPAETEPAATEPAGAETILGAVEGDTYTNEYLGFSCNVSNFEIAGVDTLVEMNGLEVGSTAVDIWRLTADEDGAYVFSANSKDGLSTALIHVRTAENDAIEALDLKAIMEANVESFTLEYQNLGYVDIECEYQELEIAGRTLHGLLLEATHQGEGFQLLSFMFTGAEYAATVTLAGLDAEALLALVASINVL